MDHNFSKTDQPCSEVLDDDSNQSITNSNLVAFIVSFSLFTDMFCLGVMSFLGNLLAVKVSGTNESGITLYRFYSIGLFFTTPVVAFISDFWQAKHLPLILGSVALSLFASIMIFSVNIHVFYIGRFLQGLSAATTWVVCFSMLSDVFRVDSGLGSAIGVAFMSSYFGYISGPFISNALCWMSKESGYKYSFYFCLLFIIIDLILRILLIRIFSKVCKKDTSEDIKMIKFEKDFIPVLLLIIISSSSFSIFESCLMCYLDKFFSIKNNSIYASLLFALNLIPNAIFSIIAGKLCDMNFSRRNIMVSGLFLFSIFGASVFYFDNIYIYCISSVLYGISLAFILTPTMPELSFIYQEHQNGKSFSQIYALYNIAYSIGMMGGATLVDYMNADYQNSILYISTLCLLYTPLLFHFYPKNRQSESIK